MINLERLREYKIVAPDVESTGLHWYRDKMFSVALAVHDGEKIHSAYYDIREKPRVVEALAAELPHCPLVVNHNLKFDTHFLRERGILLPLDRIQCTSVRAALINEHEPSFGLDALGKKYVGQGKTEIWTELAQLFGGAATRAVQIKNLHRAPVALAAKYATPDPELAIRLWLWQEEEIKRQGLESVWAMEQRLTSVLIKIEQRGIRVDEAKASEQAALIDVQVPKSQRKLNKLAGREINANSPKQLIELFKPTKRGGHWYVGKVLLNTTDGGAPSLDKDALRALAERGSEEAGLVMTLRQQIKAKSFLTNHIIGHAVKGRVHCNYNQTRGDNELGTGTGRLSIDDPALQQIPKRDKEIAAYTRSCFLPEKGDVWCCADWEQFEFRWFAHYTEDPKILAVYADDPKADFHAVVADITGIPRNPRYAGDANAKQINLGLVFGMGPGTMAAEMGMEHTIVVRNGREWVEPGSAAKDVFAKYHSQIPGVKALLAQASAIARQRGYVRTVMNRHLRFPHGKFTHKAAGLVFQGSSADCMKYKMITMEALGEKLGFEYLLSVHDEHNTSVPKKGATKLAAAIKKELETFDGVECPIRCEVPILSDVALGPNWWEACK